MCGLIDSYKIRSLYILYYIYTYLDEAPVKGLEAALVF